jgi:hypothetical protein
MPSQREMFHANISQLLADKGEVEVAGFPGAYQANFGEPIVLKGGENVQTALKRAEAAGVCTLQTRPTSVAGSGDPALFICSPSAGGYKSPWGPSAQAREARQPAGPAGSYAPGNGLGATAPASSGPKLTGS